MQILCIDYDIKNYNDQYTNSFSELLYSPLNVVKLIILVIVIKLDLFKN